MQKVFKEKALKSAGRRNTERFFEAETEIPELDGRSRELLTSLIDELKLAKEELSRSLAKAKE